MLCRPAMPTGRRLLYYMPARAHELLSVIAMDYAPQVWVENSEFAVTRLALRGRRKHRRVRLLRAVGV